MGRRSRRASSGSGANGVVSVAQPPAAPPEPAAARPTPARARKEDVARVTADPVPGRSLVTTRAIRDLVRSAVLSVVRRVRVRRRRPGRPAPGAGRPRPPGPPPRGRRRARGRPPARPSRTASRSPRSPARSSRAVRYTLLPRARPRARPGHDPDRPAPARARHRPPPAAPGLGRPASVGPRRERDGRRLMAAPLVRRCRLPGGLPERRRGLEANVDEINALNVFPVPDGDTGTNMLATVRAALEEADKAGPDADADRVAHAASFGALMGARGNSGVITSQILAGIAQGLQGKRRFNGLDLAHALDAGSKKAYKAVAKPVEGTILTVIREAAAAAVAPPSATTTSRRCSPRRSRPPSGPSPRRRRCCRSCARRTSSTRAARACSALFQGALAAARGRPVEAGAAAAAPRRRATPPSAATDHVAPRRRDRRATATRRSTCSARRAGTPSTSRRSRPPRVDRRLGAGRGRRARWPRSTSTTTAPTRSSPTASAIGTLSRITIENLDGQAHDVREASREAFLARGRRDPGVGARRPSPAGGHAHAVGEPSAGPARDAASRSASSPSPPRRASRRCSTSTPPGFREFGAVPHRPRRPVARTRRRASCSRPSRPRPADELLILPNNPNVDPRRAPGRVDDRPPDPRRPDAQLRGGLRRAARARPVGRPSGERARR